MSAVTRSVVERVEQCEKTAQWCSRDPDLLHWCFSGQLTADSFGAPLVGTLVELPVVWGH